VERNRQFERIFNEKGEFWDSPDRPPRTLRRVMQKDAIPARLKYIWRTLGNGYSHFHWRYENLSAVDYWEQQRWNTRNQQPVFGLASRGVDNFMAYVPDALVWDPTTFWDLRDLRIMVVPYITLRFSLHRFLNILLNDERNLNVFNY
jgi:hypothetical protein